MQQEAGRAAERKRERVKTAMEHLGVPGFWMNDRWVATPSGWDRIRWLVRQKARDFCEHDKLIELGLLDEVNGCQGRTQWGDTHHRFGRGGGRRDDRPTLPDGTQNLFFLSRSCHAQARIDRRDHAGKTTDRKP